MKDGGPAFPAQPVFNMPSGALSMAANDGMTLRDWFAGQALAGMLANPTIEVDKSSNMMADQEAVSEAAYILADAMLKARDADNA